ncbi:MAG TPA: hypothetical protein VLD61_00150 [Methylomirabilota bacterium]|nr:hypothetical protein [Methylomirabilota bacterium]
MRRLAVGVLMGIALLSGCAAAGLEGARGAAGGVTWEVTNPGQLESQDNQRFLWSYAVVLRETAGRSVRFEQMVHSVSAAGFSGDQVGGSPATVPFARTLPANGQLSAHFTDNWGWLWTGVQFGGASMLPTMRVERRLVGRDETGNAVVVPVRVDLNRSVGRLARPLPVSAPAPPERRLGPDELAALAGVWRGAYRLGQGVFDIPIELVIRADGSVQAGEYDPVVNRFSGTARVADGRLDLSLGRDRGTLTLHEGDGKRVLAGDLAGSRSNPDGGTRIVRYPVRLEMVPATATR